MKCSDLFLPSHHTEVQTKSVLRGNILNINDIQGWIKPP